MSSSFTRRRKVDTEGPSLFGWCQPGFLGGEVKHGKPEGVTPEPGTCIGEFVTTSTTNKHPAGTKIRCECTCHGEGRTRYDGFIPEEIPLEVDEDETDETDESPVAPTLAAVPDLAEVPPTIDESSGLQNELAPGGQFYDPEPPALSVVSEPPLPQLGNPSDEESEAVTDAPVPASTPAWVDDGIERAETKTFDYPNGSVVRCERQSVTKQGKEVTLVEWVAKLPDGTKVGTPQWSRKAAKEFLP